MNKLISLISLAFFSTSVFAARLPDSDEATKILSKIEKNESVNDVINLIKSDSLDLVSVYSGLGNGQMKKDNGRSIFASYVLTKRLDTSSPKGNLRENLNLLDLLISKGASANNIHPSAHFPINDKFWEGDATLVTMAADACSLDSIKLLERRGADLGADSFSWARALHQATQRSSDNDQPCKDVAEYLISKSRTSDFYTLKSLFFTKDTNERFLQGNYIDQSLTDNLISTINSYLNIHFSKLPDGNEPSDEWTNDFLERMAMPTTDEGDWWAAQDDSHKAWACYYSTFDEAVSGFNSIGMTREWLKTNSIGGIYTFGHFSPFMVDTFTDYCNSIK